MGSRRNFSLVFSILLSAAAYFWSGGLHPVWWLMWLAPLPLLWLGPKVPGGIAFAMGLVARALGGLALWHYYQMLHLPLWLSLTSILGPALVAAFAVYLNRSFLRRGETWLAVLAFPAVIVAGEYLTSLWYGTFGNIAYTQIHNLPVLQVGALAGIWGISFAVMLFPALLAAVFLSKGVRQKHVSIAFAAFLLCLLGYGIWRLHATPRSLHSVAVGLADSDAPQNLSPRDPQQIMALMRGYSEQVQILAAHGAKFVVLPEMIAVIPDPLSGQVDALFQQTARGAGVQVLLGVLHPTAAGVFNEARLYSADGTIETVYRKHHLVPVAEGGTTPGSSISVLTQPVGTLGVEICRDMDYPELARRYAAKNVGLVLVPAWDFDVDRAWHGHMALMRGVEDGFSVVRSAKLGFLTVSDDRGRILAETRTSSAGNFTTMLATVPVRHDKTLYQAWGDWFAWLNLAGLIVLLAFWVVGRGTVSRYSSQQKQATV